MQKLTFEDFQSRVTRGAEALDRVLPSWYRLVNTELLDLENPALCILGQLFPDRGFVQAVREVVSVDLDNTPVIAALGTDHGFDLITPYTDEHGFDDYQVLTELWVTEINIRLNDD
jgi:hypothetical protein